MHNLVSVTRQKRMNLDAELLEIITPLVRHGAAQQYAGSLGIKLLALFLNAQASSFKNDWLTLRTPVADHQERLGSLKERSNSLAAKRDGDFHGRDNDCDAYSYASDVPES